MAIKAFSGDLVDELPRGKIEPYRLWFEYLKFALKTQPGRVNRKFYESWGNVETEDFDEWFKQNWKKEGSTAAWSREKVSLSPCLPLPAPRPASAVIDPGFGADRALRQTWRSAARTSSTSAST